MAEFIRVWREVDIRDVARHLLIVGEVTGDCANCKRLGIDYANVKECPECNVTFKYIATRSREVGKIKKRRPDLIFIDLDDYKKAAGFIKAREFFK